MARGTHNLPKIPTEVQDMILYENWKAFFPEWGV